MQHAPKRIADGFISLEGGMDSGRNPSTIERNKVAYASNVRFRGGKPTNRPGFDKWPLLFRKTDTTNSAYEMADSDLQAAFEDGHFQGASIYSGSGGPAVGITVVGGRFFSIDLAETTSSLIDGTFTSGYRVKEIILTKTETTQVISPGFTIPAVGSTVLATVGSTSGMTTTYPQVVIDGATYTITTINSSTTVTIRNDTATAGGTVSGGTVVSYTVKDANSAVIPKAYFQQAEQFLIIQDGQSKPLIYDGALMRRALEKDENGYLEVPAGTVMAYGNGRLWVAVNGSYFVAGDIVGGPTGTDRYGRNDALLKFSENTYLNEGGYFRVPSQAGEITSMVFISSVDTSLGQGPLLVGTATHVFTVNVPVDRTLWKALEFPVQTIALIGNGPLSERSSVLVNGDVFYRAKDGIRSFIVARRDFGQWGNTPLSNEVSTILNNDGQSLLGFTSSVLFDNRLITTAEPVPTANGCYHRRLAVLDFHPISAIGTRTPPAYDGDWDARGVNVDFIQLITARLNGEDKCWFIARNSAGKNEFWEITKASRFDFAGTETPVNIVSYIDTPSYPFSFGLGAPGSDSMQLKELMMGELFIQDLVGTTTFVVSYKPDQSPSFYSWSAWSETVTYRDCDSSYSTPTCRSITCYSPNYRARMRLPWPAEICESGQSKPSRFGYEFQARIQWTGFSVINKFRMQAREVQEEAYGDCRSAPTFDTIVPVITSSTASLFGSGANYPAGKYRVVYVDGAMRFDGSRWILSRPDGAVKYDIIHSGGTVTQISSNDSLSPNGWGWSTEALAKSNNAGTYTEFTHTGGTIGVRFYDVGLYTDNLAGSPNPTFRLEAA